MNGKRFAISLFFLLFLCPIIPCSGSVDKSALETDHHYTTNANGNIDWSTGKITVWGCADVPPVLKDPDHFHYQNGNYEQPRNLPQARLLAKNKAREKAYQNASSIIMKIQVQNEKTLNTYMANSFINNKVNNFINSPFRLKNIETYSNKCKITLEYNLYGEKGLLLLNDDQETANNFVNFYYEKYHETKRTNSQNWVDSEKNRTWEGLVITTAAFPMTPALNPKIYAENGRIIYDSSLAYADAAAQTGLVLYAKKPFNLIKPVNIRYYHCTAIRTVPFGGSDIVISDEDANTILSSPGTLENLRRCKVIILAPDGR